MQRWAPRSQCIFCQLRTTCKRQNVVSDIRQYHVSGALLKDPRDRRPRRRDTDPQHTVRRLNFRQDAKDVGIAVRRLDFRQDAKDTIPTAERKRDLIFEKNKQERDMMSLRNEILRALRVVREGYETSKMNSHSDISQMKGLDPDGDLWPKFADEIREMMVSLDISKKRRPRGFLKELADLTSGELRAESEKAVQFKFLDYVLDKADAIKIRDSSYTIDFRYPTEWYPKTRQMQRVIHLHVGPTNSGKTYNALKRLEQAKHGFYAGPLRLLAHEVYSRFNSRGIKCELITGDDVRLDNSGESKLYASTVEMIDTMRESEVGVVDEIQMMGDSERGWAWTRAVLAARVGELHLCGEARVVPLIRELVASMGDTLHIHQYERLNPLKVMSRSLKGNLNNLRKGDCVVSFSVVGIHALKRQIEVDTGKRCAIIYGSLPPETRAQQAALFNDPDNDYDYLVASDAIGMGLNLSIKRVVFETTEKFDGQARVQLTVPQIKQIGGRAGRYRTAQDDKTTSKDQSKSASKTPSDQNKAQSIGLITCLDEKDLPVLQHALATEGPPLKTAGILPPGEFYEELARQLPEGTPFEYILKRLTNSLATNDRFRLCNIRDQMNTARTIEAVPNLTIANRLTLCASPTSGTGVFKQRMQNVMVALAKVIATEKNVTVIDVEEIPLETLDLPVSADRSYLTSLEVLHKSLILFLWLSYRFPQRLRDQDMATRAKELCEEKINTTLLEFSANPMLRKRLAEMRKSSELLRDSAKHKAVLKDMPLTMDPDAAATETDAAMMSEEREQEGQVEFEERIEVQGELDIGIDESREWPVEEAADGQSEPPELDDKDTEEPQRVSGSG